VVVRDSPFTSAAGWTFRRNSPYLAALVLTLLFGTVAAPRAIQITEQGGPASSVPDSRIATFSEFAGRWVNERAGEPAGPRPRWPKTLNIAASPTSITVDKGWGSDVYRLDGVSTDLGNDRSGSLLVLPEGVALVTRRQVSATSSVTIFVAVVRADGDTLTVDERLSSALPDGRLVRITGAARLTHMTYRRFVPALR
jgi:hypothetical protein